MKKLTLCFISAAWLLLLPNSSFACSCSLPPLNKSEKQLIELERKNSKAIFVGEVVEIIVPKTASGDPAWVSEVKFKVQKAWKGVTAGEATVFTTNVCCICGYKFTVGESYLVYAYGSSEDGLGTSICTRTRTLGDADKDLKVLGKGKVVGSGKSLISSGRSITKPCS